MLKDRLLKISTFSAKYLFWQTILMYMNIKCPVCNNPIHLEISLLRSLQDINLPGTCHAKLYGFKLSQEMTLTI